MRWVGVMLVVLGVLALVYGGITYKKNHTILRMGSVSVTATEHKRVPVPAVAGAVVLAGGVALIAVSRRRVRPA